MICPVCKNNCPVLFNDGKDYFISDGNSPSFGISYCKDCEIGLSTPYMTDQELSSYYPDEYEAYKPKKSIAAFLQTKKYKNDINIIKKYFRQAHPSLFEIGSGRGEFLNEALNAGFSVEGIEPGGSGVQYAKNTFDISLKKGYASDLKFDKKYHVIAARHVLEHINEFHKCLTEIYENGLENNGLIFIKIPRFDSWEARFFGKFCSGFDLPRHRVHFTKKGIIKILTDTGFVNIKVRDEIVPSDIIRGFQYYSKHGNKPLLQIISRIFNRMPYMIKLFKAQSTGIILSPFGAGRMIIVAKKST